MTVLVVLSGGMDSTVAAYWAKMQFGEIECVSFDYGQKHGKELDHAQRIAGEIAGRWDLVDLFDVGLRLDSALTTDNIEVPEGHYADETMKATVVPNRNMIMFSIASGLAVSRGHEAVVVGIHAGDHPIYPDCRPAFVSHFNLCVRTATEGFASEGFYLVAPFLIKSKAEIVCLGDELGVPFELTWSCYKGGAKHCGKCGTCVERHEAFVIADVSDPTEYES